MTRSDPVLQSARLGLKGDIGTALGMLRDAVESEPELADRHAICGNLALHAGLLEEATDCFAAALRLDSADLQARLGLIATTMQAGANSIADMPPLDVMIGEFGRMDHVDGIETVLLAAATRADYGAIDVILNTPGIELPWETAKLTAICHLVNRYFPFGAGLNRLFAELPHLSINNLVAALFHVQQRDLADWAARTPTRIALVNSQRKNVYNDYPIFDAIRGAGHRPAYFMGLAESSRELTDAGMDLEGTYLIAGRNVAKCSLDLLFSTSPQAAHLSENAAKVLIPHDIAGHPRGSSSDGKSIEPVRDYAAFDYFLTTNARMAADLADFISENDRMLDTHPDDDAPPARKRMMRRLVPSGYTKLDYNRINYASLKSNKEADSLLISPTDFNIHPGGITPNISIFLIKFLANIFPDREIIYRPHPNNIKSDPEEIAGVRDAFSGNPKFVLDLSTNYLEIWARAALMITDFSGGSMTFACTTGRPTLFFNPPDPTAQQAERGGILLFRDELGLTIETLDEVGQAIETLLDPAEGWATRIAGFNATAVYNLDAAAEYIAAAIPDFLQDVTPADWTELA